MKFNTLDAFWSAGSLAARARKQGDEARVKFEKDWATKAWQLEDEQDRVTAQRAFHDGYSGANRPAKAS